MEVNFLIQNPWPGIFQFDIFLVLFWVNRCVFLPLVLLRVLLTLFPYCISFQLFCYVLLIAIFCYEIVLLPLHLVVGMSSFHLLLLAGRIFVVDSECPLLSVLFYCLDIFLIFVLLAVLSGLFPWVVLLFYFLELYCYFISLGCIVISTCVTFSFFSQLLSLLSFK